MGLQVWLPLNGNLENKGLGKINNIQGTPSYRANGKIGSALELKNTKITISSSQLANLNTFTLCFWVNVNSSTSFTTDWVDIIGFNDISPTGTQGYFRCETCYNLTNWKGAHWHDNNVNAMLGSKISGTEIHTKNDDIWCHCVLVCNNKISKISFYTNGELTGEFVHNGGAINNTGTFYLGDIHNIVGAINDVRFYDEALSPMQIKLISQGLVAHYLLNRNGLGVTNLLKNGFGELGTENWQNASNMFDDVPANHPEIYHNYKKVESSEFIPIYQNHEYKFSTWIKTAVTSGSSYPSLCPYDVDKKFISYYNCADGFNLATMTTLTQELKKGDTKIYVNDLSGWNANSGHYYNYAALFGYKDSTGYTYPDGIYTRDLGFFGSGTSAKTNLDKTNNVITLNSAYTGENKPVGTKICASTAGSIYFYPLGAITYASITDWVYKEGTFVNNDPRLAVAKYVRVFAYDNCYQAGITLTDLTLLSTEDNIEYDVSGYCHNGTKYNITDYTSDTPRYSVATKFNGTNSYINIGRGGMVRDEITVNIWGYMDDWTKYNSRLISCTESGGWNFELASGGKIHFALGTGNTSNTYKSPTGYTLSELSSGWHMFTGIYDGLTVKQYVDGIFNSSNNAYTTKTPIYYHGSNSILIGAEATGSATSIGGFYFNGNISDVRIYATALSESDIQSLYNNSAFLDSSGNIYATEYTES